jgi:hypothetical protein
MRITPRWILGAALVAFLIYAYPGYIGWDTEAHLLQARAGVYTDAHPPAVAALWRLVEIFVAGPFGMLLIQALTLLAGLYLIFGRVLAPRRAAIAAAAVFVFPPICGVTALVIKDGLMAGFAILGIGLLVSDRKRLAIACLVAATAMRWNALAATFAPIVLLLPPGDRAGWRRYARSIATWIAVTVAAMALNTCLTDRQVHMWYGTHAYQDLAGTLHYVEADDAKLLAMLGGVPLASRERLRARIDAGYDAADYRQLTNGPDHLLEVPRTAGERDAVQRAWRAVVFGHPAAYLRYRWDNFRNLLRFDKPRSFAHVYVWFHVIATPESVDRLDHDATGSKIQDVLRDGAIWLSNTPVYYPYFYLAAALILLVVCRRDRLAIALLLSGIGYELAWFFLDPTGDFRYSQWLVLTTAIAAVIAATTAATRRRARLTRGT